LVAAIVFVVLEVVRRKKVKSSNGVSAWFWILMEQSLYGIQRTIEKQENTHKQQTFYITWGVSGGSIKSLFSNMSIL
jgi:hypothetical protein